MEVDHVHEVEDGHIDASIAAIFVAAEEALGEGLAEEESVDLVEDDDEEDASLAHPLLEDRPEIYNRVEELRSVILDTSRVFNPYREELIYNAITGVGRLCLTRVNGFENSVSSTPASARLGVLLPAAFTHRALLCEGWSHMSTCTPIAGVSAEPRDRWRHGCDRDAGHARGHWSCPTAILRVLVPGMTLNPPCRAAFPSLAPAVAGVA